MLSREEILGRDDLKREEVRIPEWGGQVWVRTMTGYEKDWWEAQNYGADADLLPYQQRLLNMRARLAAITVCDAEGVSLFTLNDIDMLTRKSAPALDRIWTVASRLSFTQNDLEALKNASAPGQSDVSGSDSPSR